MSKPTRTYNSWHSMRRRCTNPDRRDYRYYGGRGIHVCDRWRDSFQNFLADMGERPEGMTLDRIDNDGDYEPNNCRWATQAQQNRNQRPRGSYDNGRYTGLSELDARVVRAIPPFVGMIRVLAAELGVSEVEIMYARARP